MTTAERPSPALAHLRRARERFLTGHPLPDGVPDEVVSAWRRARFLGVRPDAVGTEARLRPSGSALLEAAQPVLERLAPVLGAGSALLLTDERLRVLWAAGDAPHDLMCADLSEQRVGHNSAALAVRTGGRAEVHGPEHFLDLWQDVSAVSVPVRAPGAGRVLGTVTVASRPCAGQAPHPQSALAEAVAEAVEAELPARSRPAERVLLDAYLAAARGQDRAVAAFGGHSRLVSEYAGRLLSPEGLWELERGVTAALERETDPEPDGAPDAGAVSVESHDTPARNAGTGSAGSHDTPAHNARTTSAGSHDTPTHNTETTPTAPRDTLAPKSGTAPAGPHDTPTHNTGTTPTAPRDTLAPKSGTASAGSYDIPLPPGAGCSATAVPVRHQGAVIGAVVVLEPADRAAAQPADRTSPHPADRGRPAALAGCSVAWRHAVERAAELAAFPGPVLVVGERGTGKTCLARELLGGRAVVDAAEGEVGDALGVLSGDRPLVLRHAERLAQCDVAALNTLLEARPDAPLLVTYTPGTSPGPCLQRLLDTLAARSVTLPALRERPEDIEELLPTLAPRPAPGHPPLTWTLDALRALKRYPWPGNVTELAHVVRSLAEHRRAAGPVRRAELPDPVREGPSPRPLSPMEDAERTAILEALHRHGGNKARTAQALGIGRATLYRKLRSYRG